MTRFLGDRERNAPDRNLPKRQTIQKLTVPTAIIRTGTGPLRAKIGFNAQKDT